MFRILFCLLLTGCALKSSPYITYSDKNHPLSDTSVFTVTDEHIVGSNLLASIVAVDGKRLVPKGAGSGFWVRVLPGEHEFEILYQLMDNGLVSYKFTNIKVSVAMNPRRIYLAQPSITDRSLSVNVKELPENSDYKMPLGLKGINYQEFSAEF